MKKALMIALIGMAAFAVPVYAQTQNDENIKSDVQALDKDNNAMDKDKADLAKDRAAKAEDKVNDDNGKQAIDSLKIGADKTAIEAKKAEKAVDEKILEHHKEEMTNP